MQCTRLSTSSTSRGYFAEEKRGRDGLRKSSRPTSSNCEHSWGGQLVQSDAGVARTLIRASSAFPLSSTELRRAGLAFIRRTRDRGKKKLNNKGISTSPSSALLSPSPACLSSRFVVAVVPLSTSERVWINEIKMARRLR